MESKGHVAISMTGGGGNSGSLDVALAREEALHRFRDINWATYTRCAQHCTHRAISGHGLTLALFTRSAGGFSLEKVEISALKDVETLAKPGAEETNVSCLEEL